MTSDRFELWGWRQLLHVGKHNGASDRTLRLGRVRPEVCANAVSQREHRLLHLAERALPQLVGVSPAIDGPPNAVPAGNAAPLHLQTDDSLSGDDGNEVDLSKRAALPPCESQGVEHGPLRRVRILP